ncbi:MAG: hypothetical protein RML72_04430 [Bacteroidia bacterium]|nr:hypothetical protein [Bacteroidia bacterium]MDW8158109.1 hypothetical protein [Bacteroidia bacterium]
MLAAKEPLLSIRFARIEFIHYDSSVHVEGENFTYSRKKENYAWPISQTAIIGASNRLGIVEFDPSKQGINTPCLTALVAYQYQKFFEYLQGDLEEITLVTNNRPEFDTIIACYLVYFYKKNGCLPKNVDVLADYVYDVVTGKVAVDIENPQTLHIYILGIRYVLLEERLPEKAKNIAYFERCFLLLDQLILRLEAGISPRSTEFLEDIQFFEHTREFILRDSENYKQDLKNSRRSIVWLENKNTGRLHQVDILATEDPKSILWKHWTRGSRIETKTQEGILATCEFYTTNNGRTRAIIRTDAQSPYWLRGLSILLDYYEIQKLLETYSQEALLEEPIKQGYCRSTPWLDGREKNDFTIVESPRPGSVLSVNEIWSCIRKYELWQYLGRQKVLYTSFDALKGQIIPDIPPSQKEVEQILEIIASSQKANPKKAFAKLEDISMGLMAMEIKSDKMEEERTNLRNQILQALIQYYNQLPATIDPTNSAVVITILINNYFPPSYLEKWFCQTRDLAPDALREGIEPLISRTQENRIIPLMLILQDRHPRGINVLLAQRANSEYQKYAHVSIATELLHWLHVLFTRDSICEDLPIYTFNRLKNYLDDCLVCACLSTQNEIDPELAHFIANDFKHFIEQSAIQPIWHPDYLTGEYPEFRKLYQRLVQKYLIQYEFGENLPKFRWARAIILNTAYGQQLEQYNLQDPESYSAMSFEETYLMQKRFLNTLGKLLKEEFGNPDIQLATSILLNRVNLLFAIKAFENLAERIDLVFRLCYLEKLPVGQWYFNYHPDLMLFQQFTIHLFSATIQFMNSSDPQGYLQNLNDSLDILNELKVTPASTPNINLQPTLNLLYRFVSNLVKEHDIPFNQIDRQIESAFNQFNLLTASDGLLSTTQALPLFYKTVLKEIFLSYKRHYTEKIKFLQSKIKSVTDVSHLGGKNEEEFIALSNYLFNQTIYFDWQALKGNVDTFIVSQAPENKNRLSRLFYRRYFYWQQLSYYNLPHLLVFNSSIRSAIGRFTTLDKIIESIPEPEDFAGFPAHRSILFENRSLNAAINHFPEWYHLDAYDYLSDHFLEKFDISSVQRSIENFSARLPAYYKIMTHKRYLSMLTLGIATLLLLIGCFDPNEYEVGGIKMRPTVAQFFWNFLGQRTYYVISKLITTLWGLLICTIYILPLAFIVYYLIRLPTTLQRKQNITLNYMQMLEKIEGKKSRLLYLQFITPLLLMILQIANPDAMNMITNIKGISFITIMFVLVGLVYTTLYNDISKVNPNRSKDWLTGRVWHMFWLYSLQAIILTFITTEVLVRLDSKPTFTYNTLDDLELLGMAKTVYYQFFWGIEVAIMPVITLIMTMISLYFSFFLNKVVGK